MIILKPWEHLAEGDIWIRRDLDGHIQMMAHKVGDDEYIAYSLNHEACVDSLEDVDQFVGKHLRSLGWTLRDATPVECGDTISAIAGKGCQVQGDPRPTGASIRRMAAYASLSALAMSPGFTLEEHVDGLEKVILKHLFTIWPSAEEER